MKHRQQELANESELELHDRHSSSTITVMLGVLLGEQWSGPCVVNSTISIPVFAIAMIYEARRYSRG